MRKELVEEDKYFLRWASSWFWIFVQLAADTNKAPRRKQRGIKSALQTAGFQPAFAPKGEELNPEEIKPNFSRFSVIEHLTSELLAVKHVTGRKILASDQWVLPQRLANIDSVVFELRYRNGTQSHIRTISLKDFYPLGLV